MSQFQEKIQLLRFYVTTQPYARRGSATLDFRQRSQTASEHMAEQLRFYFISIILGRGKLLMGTLQNSEHIFEQIRHKVATVGVRTGLSIVMPLKERWVLRRGQWVVQ